MNKQHGQNQGFTLIELSIVLVVIGLIIGAILVGQDLVAAAATRATIAQIEKYNSAVNTFKVKYGYIPGDIPDPYASQFGFIARGPYVGQGDGDGVLQGNIGGGGLNGPTWICCGELAVFWRDLSTAGQIEGGYNYAVIGFPGYITLTTSPGIGGFIPLAKAGQGNYIYPYSVNSVNYFGISAVTALGGNQGPTSTPGLSVAQAYNIDKKMDDGLPMTGSVTARYVGYTQCSFVSAGFASGGVVNGFGYFAEGASTGWPSCGPTTAATPSSSNTCYDNGNTAGAAQQYSMEVSNGSGPNCALSFKMQGAAR